MKLIAVLTQPESAARFLAHLGEPTDIPARSPSRGPPYWGTCIDCGSNGTVVEDGQCLCPVGTVWIGHCAPELIEDEPQPVDVGAQ